jgi:ribonuclease HI
MAGWLVLNTDASKPEASGDAAIGAILRQKPRPTAPMKVVAYISEVVGPVEIQEAEYQALIEGLKLALRHHPDDLQVCSPTQRSSPTRSATKRRG